MKIIDRNGRLFGKISVIDLLVVAVVVVLAAALYFKNNQAHTGTTVTEENITFQIRARGVYDYVADAIQVGDGLYDKDYASGGKAIGRITDIQVERDRRADRGGRDGGPAHYAGGPGAGGRQAVFHQPGVRPGG